MESKGRFLQVYLYFALFFGVLDLMDLVLTLLNFSSDLYTYLLGVLTVLFIFFNILAIAFLHHHHFQERLAYVLPFYYVVSYLLFFGLGLWLVFSNLPVEWFWWASLMVSFLASAFEIGFSIYLLRKFRALFKK